MPKPRVLLRETIHWSSTSYGERPSTWICRVIATFWEEAPGSSADIETIVPVPGRPFLRILRCVNGLIMGARLSGHPFPDKSIGGRSPRSPPSPDIPCTRERRSGHRAVASGGRQPARGARADGVHARLPHHHRLRRRGAARDDADRRVPGPASRGRGRPRPGEALVEGRGGPVRGRRRHRHRDLVRDGAALASFHGAVRRRLRHRVRDRGHLLLHRGDLHRDLHLRLEADPGLGPLLDRRADRHRRDRRRLQRRRRELLDEPAAGLPARLGRQRHRRPAPEGALQPGDRLRGPAHAPRRLHGGRVRARLGLRDRHAAQPREAPRPPPPARAC